MPPVFGPSSPSKARLKSLAGGSGTASRPSHNAKSDTSTPSRSSSTSSSPCPGKAAQARVELRVGSAHDDSLAGGQPVRLEHARSAGDVELPRRRHSGCRHHLLGEQLGALDPRRGCAGPEHRDARPAQLVADARDERCLRADHDQSHVERTGQAEQPFGILGAHRVAVPRAGQSPGCPGRRATRRAKAPAPASRQARARARPSRPTGRSPGECMPRSCRECVLALR